LASMWHGTGVAQVSVVRVLEMFVKAADERVSSINVYARSRMAVEPSKSLEYISDYVCDTHALDRHVRTALVHVGARVVAGRGVGEARRLRPAPPDTALRRLIGFEEYTYMH
jgi:hypothetical protein